MKTWKFASTTAAAIGLFAMIAMGQHGNSHVPKIASVKVVREVSPLSSAPSQLLYGTLDMMDLVRVNGESIVVIAHEIFPSSTPGNQGNLPGSPISAPDTYDGLNRGLGLGAVTAWNMRTGTFSFIVPPKNTAAQEPYDENKHTSATDGVRATDWGTALIAEEWSQRGVSGVIAARGGHILEVDPTKPGQVSRIKAVGSFSHEGITIRKLEGNYVFYQGDEQRGSSTPRANGTPVRGGALYRFIPNAKPRKFGDLKANGGTLEAFDFFYRQLSYEEIAVVTADNPDVIREWADTNLTPISLWERPEDVEWDAVGGYLYFAVTEKSCVVQNGACLVDSNGNTVDANGSPVSFDGARNRGGHIVRLNPDTGEWSIFVDADSVNTQYGISTPTFGNPDNLAIDYEGRVWIAQDGGNPNDSLWLATPDKSGDGVADFFTRFLNMADANLGVPADSGEPTGFLFLDEKKLLLNWQGASRTDDVSTAPVSRILMLELGGVRP
ncbi:MAG: DUF839 domain-containing protein [Acidobacteria bacterium]|nr:DUF839 domain-containing protein [Acidobacteriota bacterium]